MMPLCALTVPLGMLRKGWLAPGAAGLPLSKTATCNVRWVAVASGGISRGGKLPGSCRAGLVGLCMASVANGLLLGGVGGGSENTSCSNTLNSGLYQRVLKRWVNEWKANLRGRYVRHVEQILHLALRFSHLCLGVSTMIVPFPLKNDRYQTPSQRDPLLVRLLPSKEERNIWLIFSLLLVLQCA